MELLKSSKMTLPIVYLVENEEDLKTIPIGIPFIRGSKKEYDKFVRLLEFEILLKTAKESGLPFNWIKLLESNGYSGLRKAGINISSKEKRMDEFKDSTTVEFITDISFSVNFEVLKRLSILPSWYSNIEKAVEENIRNTILFNPYLYNKKMELCTGACVPTSPDRNLIIIDISSSIPKSVSEATLLLSQTMATLFYADLLITGSKTTLYEYDKVSSLDVKTIYKENGVDNDQLWFKDLVSVPRKYNTVIAFGDNHHAGMTWRNEYNGKEVTKISYEEGKRINKWSCNKIISLHTTSDKELAGYATWLDCPNIEYVSNWVQHID